MNPEPVTTDNPDGIVRRFRLRYSKKADMRFLGHQDVIRVFHRALRREGLRPDYSKGFHPHPRMRFSPPLALGIESTAEYVDLDLVLDELSASEVMSRLAKVLPEGITPLEIEEIPLNDPPVSARIEWLTYEITFKDFFSREDVARKVLEFSRSETCEIVDTRKAKTRTRDLKHWMDSLDVSGHVLKMTLKSGPSGSVHPLEAAGAVLGLSKDEARLMPIVKTSVGLGRSRIYDEGPPHGQ